MIDLSLWKISIITKRLRFFYPGHPLFQGLSRVLATRPIVLLPALGPSISSWPLPINACDPP